MEGVFACYFSSNRPGGKGKDDIWHAYERPLEFTMTGTAYNKKTGNTLSGCKVTIIGSDGSTYNVVTDANGSFFLDKTKVKVETKYTVDIQKENFIGTADKLMLKAAQTAGNKSGAAVGVGANAPEFGQINLTMAKFYRVNGSTTQHKGVVPDIELPTVFPKDKYGESSEPRALPWDTIAPSKYSLVTNLDDVKRKLLFMHKERMKNSLGYQNLQQDIAEFAKRESETTITLNEVQLKKERDDQEAKVLERENQRRALKGLPPLKKGQAKPKDDVDFIRDEGLQIMADYINVK
jgi:hypothetical protein